MRKRIAIIANGEEPRTRMEREALGACAGCVCCDRLPPEGAPELLQVVGDLDTVRREAVAPQLLTDEHADQESNDLSKAMRWVRTRYAGEDAQVAFFGVTGKREDHTLANLALIAGFEMAESIYTPAGFFRVLQAGEHRVATTPGGAISFLSFVPQRISATGVVWQVQDLLLDTLWRATLNRCTGAEVTVRGEAPLLVFQPWRS